MKTDYLFASPSFSGGIARLLDLFGRFDDYNDSPSGEAADARAVYSDWRITGEDLARAMVVIEREQSKAASESATAGTGRDSRSGRAGRARRSD